MNITAQMVKELRDKTGAGMMDSKKALVEADGDMEKAMEVLRQKGMASAEKKMGRIAAEGRVESYVDDKCGALVEINCETDFVARSDNFVAFCKDIALQIAAAKPLYVTSAEVPTDVLDHEKEILRIQALNEGKPEAIVDRMIEGRVKKFYEEVCLLDQPFVKDPSKTIKDLLNEAILTIGEKISIRRFTRYEMGEGLEKRKDNFADEVMSQMK